MPGIIGVPQFDPGFDKGGKPSNGRTNQDSTRIITPEELEFGHDSNAYELAIYDADQDVSVQQPSTHDQDDSADDTGAGNNPIFNKEMTIEPNERARQEREAARNKRNKPGSSETEVTTDTKQAEDEISVPAMLPNIAEMQDDFGSDQGLADSISPEGLYGCGNVDILLVRQDMETRPLTYSRCFEEFPSPRMACDFLYAEVPNCSNSELAVLQRKVSLGMSGDPDSESDDDWVGIGPESDGFILDYEAHLESVYGYQIEWDNESYGTNRLKQLENLARSTNYIIKYLAQEVFDGDERKAMIAFQQNFSQSEEYGKLVIYLGADGETGGAGLSRVPLQESLLDRELRKMYLGSAADIPSIVHEFGHVVDRSRGITDHLIAVVSPYRMSQIATATRIYAEDRGHTSWALYSFNLDGTVHSNIIEGFVAKHTSWTNSGGSLHDSSAGPLGFGTNILRAVDRRRQDSTPATARGGRAASSASISPHKYYSDFDSENPEAIATSTSAATKASLV